MSWFLQARRHFVKVKSIAAGIDAELSSFFDGAFRRRYAEDFRYYYDHCEDEEWCNKHPFDDVYPKMNFESIEHAERFFFYRSAVSEVGLLGADATKSIVYVYSILLSIRRNLYQIEASNPNRQHLSAVNRTLLKHILDDWEIVIIEWDDLKHTLKWLAK